MGKTNSPASASKLSSRAPIDWSEKAAKDRLSSTLFLAALFHGVLILGITFSSDGREDPPAATSLNVVIVTSDSDLLEASEDANVLAQQNLDGAGNTDLPDQLETAVARSSDANIVGPDRAGAEQAIDAGKQVTDRTVLSSTSAPRLVRQLPDELGEPEKQPVEEKTGMPGDTRYVEIVNEPDLRTLISDAGPRELVISASTRESRIAAYLSNWKREVERVGTLNFPRQAGSREFDGHPTLEVVIASDGVLRDVVVRNSSGQAVLDDAAVEILRIAAPFKPFPDFLRTDYDSLRFAYEWRFGAGGGVRRMTAAPGS